MQRLDEMWCTLDVLLNKDSVIMDSRFACSPPWEVKVTFLIHQHGQWLTVTNQWFPVKGHLMWLWKREEDWNTMSSPSQAIQGANLCWWKSEKPPQCSCCLQSRWADTSQQLQSQTGQAGERCELQTSADSARSNSKSCLFQPFTCLTLGLLMLRTIKKQSSLRS